MAGAAAAALMAVAPALQAQTPADSSKSLRAAVRSALSLPRPAAGSRWNPGARLADPLPLPAVVIENGDDITVGVGETAIGYASDQDDITLVNTGDLTGGIGIDVSTGVADLDDPLSDETMIFSFGGAYRLLYDEAGNLVYGPGGYPLSAATAQYAFNYRSTILARDPLDSTLSVENAGTIAFSGRHGIRASNPAGESVDIVNTGDITSTQDTAFRSGIYVSTEAYSQTQTATQTATGEFTYNAYGQLTGVVSPDEFTVDNHTVDMEYDGGAIFVENSGDIDMGAVASPPDFGGPSHLASAGIFTIGDGGTTIVNTGDIRVDRWSAGIHAATTATASITNAGRIEIGNYSSGISVSTSRGRAGDYRLGGDIYVLNTGEIRGGASKDEVGPGELANVDGISVFSLGSNNEYLAAQAHVNEIFSRYNEILGEEAYELFDVPNTRLYDTTVVNRGHIELQDGAAGIAITPRAGYSTAINEGTIIVGDGNAFYASNFNSPSAGILQSNFSVNGLGTTASVNAATGVIVTGDDSVGIGNYNIGGTSIAVNEGSITTGDGVSELVTDIYGQDFDRLFQSRGILSISAARMFGTMSYAGNRGDVTVGTLAVGMFVSGQGYSLLDPLSASAINVNEGIVTTGDNSSGMFTLGTSALTYNSGTITTGNYDISGYQPHAEYTADEFAQLRYGAAASGVLLADLVNHGRITTGNGTVGASARMYYAGAGLAARVIQGEDGIIETGDASIGVRVAGNYSAALYNEGRVSTGNASVGADMTAGSVSLFYGETAATVVEGVLVAANAGIIETGDNSVGVRLAAVHEGVAYSGRVLVPDPYAPYGYAYVDVSGTADSIGAAYLVNSGRISVGAGSTAVEIAGRAANDQGLHLFNVGTIEARGGAGTALSVNAANGIGSYVVNVGTIAGDVAFGDGDDRLVNTLYLDNFGRLVSSGNIVMHGSTIDFGAGDNRFDNDRGVITFGGGDNLITGADLVMTQASIESRDGIAGSLLTIDGNLSGSFVFGADVSQQGADRVLITGDVADGSSMGIVLSPTQQLRGETRFELITIEGGNGASAPAIAGVSGRFADSLLGAEAGFDEDTGAVFVTARFGMGHMATAAVSTTALAQNWWSQTAGSYDRRNMHRLAGAADTGLSVWGAAFHEEGTIEPGNVLQDTSFDQRLSGLQSGIQWTVNVGDGSFSVSPLFTYGDARASLNANIGSATGDAWAYGLNASYVLANGLYFDATWQTMTMDVDFRTPGTLAAATGNTDADADGFTVETGYPVRLQSGLTLAPQLQYTYVDTELDDFTSSDGTYALTGMSGKSSLLRAGVSVFKTFETRNGSVTPVANVDYLDELDGESWLVSNGVGFENDTSGSGYRVELGLAGRYKGWDITGRVGLTDTSVFQQSLSTNLNVRYRW